MNTETNGEREAFETWAREAFPLATSIGNGLKLKWSSNAYRNADVALSWDAWQARAALASRPAEPQPVALSDEQIAAIWRKDEYASFYDQVPGVVSFARAILAAASPQPGAESRPEIQALRMCLYRLTERLGIPCKHEEAVQAVQTILGVVAASAKQGLWVKADERRVPGGWQKVPPAPAVAQGLSEEQQGSVRAALESALDYAQSELDSAVKNYGGFPRDGLGRYITRAEGQVADMEAALAAVAAAGRQQR